MSEPKRPKMRDYMDHSYFSYEQEKYIDYMEAKINNRNKREWMMLAYLILHKVAIAWCLIEIYN